MRMLLLCVVDRYGGLDGAGGDRKDLGVRLYYIDGVGFVCYLDACIRKVHVLVFVAHRPCILILFRLISEESYELILHENYRNSDLEK